ncbi:hypothetical protein [Nesterenkonia muleiensis]|uniref:hypothetical protein n=1 Tax=Nesterenkonia muleiensis TaxID=2282648 RepID=UPI001300BD70|nr:hypothetical protein [Nesterenkonia muleiensis]
MRTTQLMRGLVRCAVAAVVLTGCSDNAESSDNTGTDIEGEGTPDAHSGDDVGAGAVDPEGRIGGTEDIERPEELSEDVFDIISSDPGLWEPSTWDFDDFDFPSCGEIEQWAGGQIGNLVLRGELITPPEHEFDPFSMTCVWDTEAQERIIVESDVEALWELDDAGSLVMSINVPPSPISKEDAAFAGFYFQDDRAEEIGGYVFAPENTDLGASLSSIGVGVSYDGVDVRWGAGGGFLHEVETLTEFTNDWAIEAGVAVHELMWN